MKLKPSAEDVAIIKTIASRGSSPHIQIASIVLEPRINNNVNDPEKPCDMNAALVSNEIDTGWNDTDLADYGRWSEFRNGVQLTDDGHGIFDFYLRRRGEQGGELCGNVLCEFRDSKLFRVWIEGGNDWSWTPETGIVAKGLRR